MRIPLASCVLVLVACGGNNSTNNPDASPTGDGSGSGVVDAPTGTPATVSLTLVNRPNAAATFSFLVAYQDGSAPWTLAPAPSGDTYTFPISSSVWSAVWTCIPAGPSGTNAPTREVNLVSFGVAERTSFTAGIPARCTDRNATPGSLSGTVLGAVGQGAMSIAFGVRAVAVPPAGMYSLETPPGTHDLITVQLANNNGVTDLLVDAAVVQRSVTAPASGQNVNWATNMATQSFAVTINGASGRPPITATTLVSANGTATNLVVSGKTFETRSLAAAQMTAGDVYDIAAIYPATGSREIATSATATPAATTFDAPPALGGATATVPSGTTYPEVKTSWSAYTGAIGYELALTQTQSATQCAGISPCQVSWTSTMSPGVLGGSPSYQLPDLSALAGWKAGFQLVAGTAVAGNVQAMTSTVGATDFPPGVAAPGTQRTFARSDYTVTP